MRPSLICLLWLSLAAVAHAQTPVTSTEELEAIRKKRGSPPGPFYPTPAIQLKELGYDNNVFNDPVDPLADYTLTVTPSAKVWVPLAQRALITTNAGADFVYFAKYSTERSIDPGVNVR